MLSQIYDHLIELERLACGRRVWSLLVVAGLLLQVPLLAETLTSPWLVGALVAVYAILKVQDAATARKSASQWRLSGQFISQPIDTPQLWACIEHEDHLWRNSVILKGLRATLRHPASKMLNAQARGSINAGRFAAFMTFISPFRRLAGLLLALYLFFRPASPLLAFYGTPLAYYAAVAGFSLTLVSETILFSINDSTNRIQYALSLHLGHWAERIEERFTPLQRLQHEYEHERLYRSVPWFSRGDRSDRPYRRLPKSA